MPERWALRKKMNNPVTGEERGKTFLSFFHRIFAYPVEKTAKWGSRIPTTGFRVKSSTEGGQDCALLDYQKMEIIEKQKEGLGRELGYEPWNLAAEKWKETGKELPDYGRKIVFYNRMNHNIWGCPQMSQKSPPGGWEKIVKSSEFTD